MKIEKQKAQGRAYCSMIKQSKLFSFSIFIFTLGILFSSLYFLFSTYQYATTGDSSILNIPRFDEMLNLSNEEKLVAEIVPTVTPMQWDPGLSEGDGQPSVKGEASSVNVQTYILPTTEEINASLNHPLSISIAKSGSCASNGITPTTTLCNSYGSESACNARACITGWKDANGNCKKFYCNWIDDQCKEHGCKKKNLCSGICLPKPKGDCCANCGDGILESGEECDDGNDIEGDGCDKECEIESTPPPCPNGTLALDGSEECDDGDFDLTDTCDRNCNLTYCGDGYTQNPNGKLSGGKTGIGDEECDGESNCDNDCKLIIPDCSASSLSVNPGCYTNDNESIDVTVSNLDSTAMAYTEYIRFYIWDLENESVNNPGCTNNTQCDIEVIDVYDLKDANGNYITELTTSFNVNGGNDYSGQFEDHNDSEIAIHVYLMHSGTVVAAGVKNFCGGIGVIKPCPVCDDSAGGVTLSPTVYTNNRQSISISVEPKVVSNFDEVKALIYDNNKECSNEIYKTCSDTTKSMVCGAGNTCEIQNDKDDTFVLAMNSATGNYEGSIPITTNRSGDLSVAAYVTKGTTMYDICSIHTVSPNTCGDNFCGVNETCEFNGNNSNQPFVCPSGNLPTGAICRSQNTKAGGCNYCGDGVLDGDVNQDGDSLDKYDEQCDDGKGPGGSNYTDNCGYGKECCHTASYTDDTKRCKTYKGPYCGDGIKNGSEGCDDGNNTNNDKCTNNCTKTYCGDKVIQNPNGDNIKETCDDGKGPGGSNYTDNCGYGKTCCHTGTFGTASQRCKTYKGPYCGDGKVNGSEACDEGVNNGNGTSGCSSNCKKTCGGSCSSNANCSGSLKCKQSQCVHANTPNNTSSVTANVACGCGAPVNCSGSWSACLLSVSGADCGTGTQTWSGTNQSCGGNQCAGGVTNGSTRSCTTSCTDLKDYCIIPSGQSAGYCCGDEDPAPGTTGYPEGDEKCDDGNDATFKIRYGNMNWGPCIVPQGLTNPTIQDDTNPTYCDPGEVCACTLNSCGDGYLNYSTETCEKRNATNWGVLKSGLTAGDACRQTGATDECTYCGDGNKDSVEECDDGGERDESDACIMDIGTYSCKEASCGDGYIWTTDCTGSDCETCDVTSHGAADWSVGVAQSFLGGTVINDCRDNTNTWVTAGGVEFQCTYCGDNVVNNSSGSKGTGKTPEECDDGSDDSSLDDYADDLTNVWGDDWGECLIESTNQCILNTCGDNRLYSAGGEQCDDGLGDGNVAGNIPNDGDEAGKTHYSTPANANNIDYGYNFGKCNMKSGGIECKLNYCGDGYLGSPNGTGTGGPANDGKEECDDKTGIGSFGDGDDSSKAQFNPANPLVWGDNFGKCNMDNVANYSCALNICGDDRLNNNPGSEQCDDGLTNGTTDSVFNQVLRDTNGNLYSYKDSWNQQNAGPCIIDSTSTNPQCVLNVCGDGYLGRPNSANFNEECDDGNNTDGDGCASDCTLECGNGSKEPIEECDDGNLDNGDGCNEFCLLESTSKPWFVTRQGSVFSDGNISNNINSVKTVYEDELNVAASSASSKYTLATDTTSVYYSYRQIPTTEKLLNLASNLLGLKSTTSELSIIGQKTTSYNDINYEPKFGGFISEVKAAGSSNWYSYFEKLFEENGVDQKDINQFTGPQTFSEFNSNCSQKYQGLCFIKITGDLIMQDSVNAKNSCDEKAVIFVDGQLTVYDDLINSDKEKGCLFIVNGNIVFESEKYKEEANQWKGSPTIPISNYVTGEPFDTSLYDEVQGYFISTGDITIANSSGVSNSLFVRDAFLLRGGLVAGGAGTNIEIKRDLDIRNNIQPSVFMVYDPRMLDFLTDFMNYSVVKIREL